LNQFASSFNRYLSFSIKTVHIRLVNTVVFLFFPLQALIDDDSSKEENKRARDCRLYWLPDSPDMVQTPEKTQKRGHFCFWDTSHVPVCIQNREVVQSPMKLTKRSKSRTHGEVSMLAYSKRRNDDIKWQECFSRVQKQWQNSTMELENRNKCSIWVKIPRFWCSVAVLSHCVWESAQVVKKSMLSIPGR